MPSRILTFVAILFSGLPSCLRAFKMNQPTKMLNEAQTERAGSGLLEAHEAHLGGGQARRAQLDMGSYASAGTREALAAAQGLALQHPEKKPDPRSRAEPAYKSIGSYWMPPVEKPFQVVDMVAAKSIERTCWWVEELKKADLGRPLNKRQRIAPLAADTKHEQYLVDMLENFTLAGKKTLTESVTHAMHADTECTLHDIKEVSDKVVVPLDHPVTRILQGVAIHAEGHEQTHPKYKFFQRAAFQHNFVGSSAADTYVQALRNASDEKHEKAMRLTFCPSCQTFMLPIIGYYIRKNDDLRNVAFVCTCDLEADMKKVVTAWGYPDKLGDSAHVRTNFTQTMNEENRKWVEEVYAADLSLYNDNCALKCKEHDSLILRDRGAGDEKEYEKRYIEKGTKEEKEYKKHFEKK